MSSSNKRRKLRWNFLSMVPYFDSLCLITLYSTIVISAIVAVIHGYVYPVAKVYLKKNFAWIDLDYNRLDHLQLITQTGANMPERPYFIDAFKGESKGDLMSDSNLLPGKAWKKNSMLERIQAMAKNSSNLAKAEAALREETSGVGNAFMKKWINEQKDLWQKLVLDKLCKNPERELRLEEITFDDSPNGYIEALIELGNYSSYILNLYDDCTEERVEVIDENFLHFTFNHYNKFDMSDQDRDLAFESIRQLVDKHMRDRRNNIQVRGHCDGIGGEDYNYILSFQRALFVGNLIRSHLGERGLIEGKDYNLALIGYGKRRPLARELGESKESHYSRCRRIELAFQGLRRPQN